MDEKTMPGDDRPNYVEEYERSTFIGESLVEQNTTMTPDDPNPVQYANSTPANETWAEEQQSQDVVTETF